MQDEIKKPDEEIEETVVDDENETVDDSDDEFEYDDEGNIIIPDVTDDEDVESDEDAADDNNENPDDEQGDESRIRRSALPRVWPKPRSKGSRVTLACVELTCSISTRRGFRNSVTEPCIVSSLWY